MTSAAPRLDPRLARAVAHLDRADRPIAETAGLVCVEAERLGCARPSYERIRLTVHAHRRRLQAPSVAVVLRDVSFRRRPPTAILEAIQDIVGDDVPGRRLI